MLFTMSQLDEATRYRLMASTIVPRPIAWLTTQDASGRINAAPFSCFGMMGSAPPLVVIGIQSRPDGRDKDSCANICATGELVVNLVAHGDSAAMSVTALDCEPYVDESALACLHLVPSSIVAPPRIGSSPASLECKVNQILRPGPNQTVILAEVVAMQIRDDVVLNAERGYIDTPAMQLLGRMEGPAWYTRCEGREHIPMPTLASLMP